MKISRKLSISIFAVLAAVCSLALFFHYRLMMSTQKNDLESLGSILGSVIEESLAYSMITRDSRLLNKTLRNLQDVEPISRILLLNGEKRVMAGTEPGARGKSLDSLDAGATQLDSGESTYRWVQRVRNRSECHPCHSPLAGYNGSILIDFSTIMVENGIRRHIVREWFIFIASFSIVGLVTFFFSNSIIITRLNRAIDHMRRLKDGNENARIPVTGNDEITRLSRGFNEMADSISDTQKELKQHASELLALAASSHVVTAVPPTENLYEAVCNIAIRELKITMAWIGLVEKGSHKVEPVAQSGFEEGYLSTVKVAWDDSDAGNGPTGMAIKKKVPQVINDITTEPAYRYWRDEAMKRGYRSSMALPLLSSSGESLGALNLYSDRPGYFTRKRVRMFMIFSNQVSTAIENRTLIEDMEKINAELTRQFEFISRSQKEWQMTFDSITDMVSIHDRNFRIIKANKAVADFFGLPVGEVINKNCHEIFHDRCSIPANCPHRMSIERNQAMKEEVRDPRTGRMFHVSAFPYYSECGDFIGSVHVARDITQEKEIETRLVMSERLAALGQMASGLAHEINTPLASIAGCAEGLLAKVKNNRYDPKLFEEYLQIVEEEIQRCKSITTGMLSFVRSATYENKEVSINSALDRALDIIGFQGRLKEVTIDRRYREDLPVIYGSEGELRQVFLAIIINALDAMEDTGILTFETGSCGDSISIKISDTGPGIAPENMSRIFDPFFTTKSEKSGTGLGLSIAYKIITNHGGTLDVFSEEGIGTTFSINLPMPGTSGETADSGS